MRWLTIVLVAALAAASSYASTKCIGVPGKYGVTCFDDSMRTGRINTTEPNESTGCTFPAEMPCVFGG